MKLTPHLRNFLCLFFQPGGKKEQLRLEGRRRKLQHPSQFLSGGSQTLTSHQTSIQSGTWSSFLDQPSHLSGVKQEWFHLTLTVTSNTTLSVMNAGEKINSLFKKQQAGTGSEEVSGIKICRDTGVQVLCLHANTAQIRGVDGREQGRRGGAGEGRSGGR